jgi:hypothetical protein
MTKTLLLLFITVTFATAAHPQGSDADSAFKIVLLKAKKGAVMVYSGKKRSFTIAIESDSISTTDSPNWLMIDNQIVQVNCIPIPNGADASKFTPEQQQQMLNGYVQYEMNYFQKELKLSITDLKKEWLTFGDRLFLLWYFDVPKQKVKGVEQPAKQTMRQVYLTTLWFDQVLDLYNALIDDTDLEKAKKMLYPLAKSIKSYKGELDIEAYAKTLE